MRMFFTVTLHSAWRSGSVVEDAVMMASPAENAFTLPKLSTEATSGLLELHASVLSAEAGSTVADNLKESPTKPSHSDLSRIIDSTEEMA